MTSESNSLETVQSNCYEADPNCFQCNGTGISYYSDGVSGTCISCFSINGECTKKENGNLCKICHERENFLNSMSAPIGYKPSKKPDSIEHEAKSVIQHVAIQQHLLGENHPLMDCSARIPVDPGFFGAVFKPRPPIMLEKDDTDESTKEKTNDV